jgi:hypothetical protein
VYLVLILSIKSRQIRCSVLRNRKGCPVSSIEVSCILEDGNLKSHGLIHGRRAGAGVIVCWTFPLCVVLVSVKLMVGGLAMKHLLLGAIMVFVSCAAAFGQPSPASPAVMISDFRVKHGEGRVTLDATLTRIAHAQAAAMAAKDQLDHNVLGGFNSRVSPAGAAEQQRTSRSAMKASQKHSINGSIRQDIDETCCCTMARASGLRMRKAPRQGARIGRW